MLRHSTVPAGDLEFYYTFEPEHGTVVVFAPESILTSSLKQKISFKIVFLHKKNMHRYSKTQLFSLVEKIFLKAGCSPDNARTVADMLIAAEMRGIPSHGLMRIKDYIGLWQKGRLNMSPDLKIVHETPSTATVDGDLAPGMVAG